jgi:DNA-binding transcriptional MerR regulator
LTAAASKYISWQQELAAVNKAPDAFRTISEVADELELPQHVLRFWETRFSQIRPMKRGGGRRYYRPDDVDLLRGIRHLLYGEGYTIRGVQRILKDNGPRFVQSVWQAGAPQPAQIPGDLEGEGAAMAGDGVAERGRGLLGLLPSLLAKQSPGEDPVSPRRAPVARGAPILPTRSDEADAEDSEAAALVPSADSDREAAKALSSAPAGLAREQIAKLQATLAELTECRRMIDAALSETP